VVLAIGFPTKDSTVIDVTVITRKTSTDQSDKPISNGARWNC
jgi:hypothetical protein